MSVFYEMAIFNGAFFLLGMIAGACLVLILRQRCSTFLIHPTSAAGKAWIDKHIPDAKKVGDAVTVEERDVFDIVHRAIVDGLDLRYSSEINLSRF